MTKAITIKELVDLYTPHMLRKNTANTIRDKKTVLAQFVEAFGGRDAMEITPSDLQAWTGQHKSGWTARRIASTVKRVFAWAVQAELIDAHPLGNPHPNTRGPGAKAITRRHGGLPVLADIKTVADVIDWFLANEPSRLVERSEYERNRIFELFKTYAGHVPIRKANPAMLYSFIMGQTGVDANWTRRRWRITICRPFNFAARMGLIPKCPFLGVEFDSGKCGRDWTKDEFQTVLRSSGAHFRRVVVFLRFSGARQGELRHLRWDQIDHAAGVIVQKEHKTARKTGTPRRIYLNRITVKLLAWIRRQGHEGEYVFLNTFNKCWTMRALNKRLDAARIRAGLPMDVALHGCRHLFATSAIVNGVDVATLAQLLSHKNTVMTSRYLHLVNQQSHLSSAADRAIGGKVEGKAAN